MVSWEIKVEELNKWLKKKGLYEKYWSGQIEKPVQLRLQFVRETNPEKHKEILKDSGKQTITKNQELKDKFVEMLGGKCERCGFNEDNCALQFHHKNPKDKWSKTTFSGYQENQERFEKDIKAGKIALLCANCHCITHKGNKKHHRSTFKYKDYAGE